MTRFSIRWLLLVVAFFAVACAALKYAGPVWLMIVSTLAFLLFSASAVIAVAGNGEWRAKAAGCAVCFVIYGSLLWLSSIEQLVYFGPLMPTSQLMNGFQTTPAAYETATAGAIEFDLHEYLARTAVGHLLAASLFGMLGCSFAGFVYRRTHPASDD